MILIVSQTAMLLLILISAGAFLLHKNTDLSEPPEEHVGAYPVTEVAESSEPEESEDTEAAETVPPAEYSYEDPYTVPGSTAELPGTEERSAPGRKLSDLMAETAAATEPDTALAESSMEEMTETQPETAAEKDDRDLSAAEPQKKKSGRKSEKSSGTKKSGDDEKKKKETAAKKGTEKKEKKPETGTGEQKEGKFKDE